jgi:hypothetical protein
MTKFGADVSKLVALLHSIAHSRHIESDRQILH